MASPFRRRRLCILVAERPAPAALREVNGRGALLETAARPPIGAIVELHHPEAGAIRATVIGRGSGTLRLQFPRGEAAVAFALAAVATDMTRP